MPLQQKAHGAGSTAAGTVISRNTVKCAWGDCYPAEESCFPDDPKDCQRTNAHPAYDVKTFIVNFIRLHNDSL